MLGKGQAAEDPLRPLRPGQDHSWQQYGMPEWRRPGWLKSLVATGPKERFNVKGAVDGSGGCRSACPCWNDSQGGGKVLRRVSVRTSPPL